MLVIPRWVGVLSRVISRRAPTETPPTPTTQPSTDAGPLRLRPHLKGNNHHSGSTLRPQGKGRPQHTNNPNTNHTPTPHHTQNTHQDDSPTGRHLEVEYLDEGGAEEDPTVPSEQEQEDIHMQQMVDEATATMQGHQAFGDLLAPGHNPYPVGTKLYRAWDDAWHSAAEEEMSAHAPDPYPFPSL